MSPEETKDYQAAKDHLKDSDRAKQLFNRIEKSRTEFKLSLNNTHDDSYDPKTHTVNWDPRSAMKTTDGGTQSPATGLVHEIDHALANPVLSAIRGIIHAGRYQNMEEARVIKGSERVIVRDLGEGMRQDHYGDPYHVQNPGDR